MRLPWSFDPVVVGGLVGAALAYAAGMRKLRRAAGARRGVRPRHIAAFYAGLAVIAGALVSPLDSLAHALFSAHMVQHLLLMIVAAPLLVYGRPLVPVLLGLPLGARRSANAWSHRAGITAAARLLTHPVVAGGLHVAALWAWHLPVLYEAAVEHSVVHVAEHLSFLGTALLLWALVIQTSPRRRVAYPLALLLVFATALAGGGLGALLTFATAILYPLHAGGATAFGLTPLQDQQLAGAIMWVPGGMVYFTTMAVLALRWLRQMERDARRRDEVAPQRERGLRDAPEQSRA